MPTITIDGKQITVPEGTNVLEAAKGVDIVIPHFCYHEALGAVGACRLCAMTFLEGPVKGLQMACMVKAKDGMVVSTAEPDSVEMRKHVIEWLMINHPHDCPVCDEGGECQLQDMTVAGGHTLRRYGGKKKTYNNQYLGPFVWHEMNRCIQCYRCVRTYQDYCGGTDFGVMGSNQRIYFGRFGDGRLESPFSGNIVDACPTGVFTDKTFRYRTRYWDLEEAPGVCPHCSLGCAIIPGARYRELQRVRGGVNRQTNGWFICDRGRFGYGHANHPERPRVPRMGEHEVPREEALAAAKGRLMDIAEEFGPRSVAFLGSPRATLEANWLLRELARSLGSDRIAFSPHPERDRAARMTAARLGELARSQAEIRLSDCVVLIGADPLNEGPTMALAVRQAVRGGASAAVIDPRPVDLPFPATHLPLPPRKLAEVPSALASGEFGAFSRQEAAVLEGIAARLKKARAPVLIGGTDLLGSRGVRALTEAARSLGGEERPCGAAFLLPGPNSFGAALLGESGPDFEELLTDIEEGRVKALVCLESDPFADHCAPSRSTLTLSRLELLVALDCLPTETVRRADIFLPTTVPAETAGTYLNNEGRMLPFGAVFDPGVPIRVTGGGDHPPRTFDPTTPGSKPRPAWSHLCSLLGRSSTLSELRERIEDADGRFRRLTGLPPEGLRISGAAREPAGERHRQRTGETPGTLGLLATEALFGSEVFAAFSPVLDPVRPLPYVLLHPGDAARLGLAAGQTARLHTDAGPVEARVHLSDEMAPGLVIVPRLRGTGLEIFVPGGGLRDCLVEKGEAP